MHVIIVVCYHPLPCCVCTAPSLYDFWHCHPYIVQHFVFTLVLLVFMIVCSCAELHLLYLGWHDRVTTDYSPHGTLLEEYINMPSTPHVSCYIPTYA